jgi:hypothetical protein
MEEEMSASREELDKVENILEENKRLRQELAYQKEWSRLQIRRLRQKLKNAIADKPE